MTSEIEQYVGNRSIEVKSDANPLATDLLQLRHEVQHREELRQVFLNESPVAWLDKISLLTGASLDAIQYLIDEYTQLGTEGVQIIDPETGKTLLILKDEDFYQPESVPRDSGEKVERPLQLRPELQGALFMFLHDRDRERNIVTTLTEKAAALSIPFSALQVATRQGRKKIVANVADRLQSGEALFARLGGPAKVFVNASSGAEGDLTNIVEGEFSLMEKLGIQDPTTLNLRFSSTAWLLTSLSARIVKEVAKRFVESVEATERLPETRYNPVMWVTAPDLVKEVRRISDSPILVVDGLYNKVVAVNTSKFGVLKVGAGDLVSAEGFDRWEVRAKINFSLKFNDGFTCYKASSFIE